MKGNLLTDWFTAMKLDLWDRGYVDSVGYVKKSNSILVQKPKVSELNDLSWNEYGIAVSSHVFLTQTKHLSKFSHTKQQEYALTFAIRDVFSGEWSSCEYLLRCYNNEPWIQNVYGMAHKEAEKKNTYQMTKSKPYELRNRASFSVRGRELPQPRRFKS
ncbi:hypothetical protein [Saccharicrinis aurantiacus]|uniref:hypothetical protein n=1 Tax=Saccharicrinis aurantiacus TaxID=1849719 RepID=UPI00094FE353|nr:hypothetical protein [Saccharicrinis aurantiacus]